tara:strand:+ start:407 stop:724 length:318 start_codon:yes stop_codon:yes gene_type:complete
MNVLDFINPFKDVTDLVSEVVEDKDKANEINKRLMEVAENTYMTELGTKTIPWVDALHKMGRQITSYLGYALAFYMVSKGNVDPVVIMASLAPGGIYAALKNKKS